jgi:hypothetical protein
MTWAATILPLLALGCERPPVLVGSDFPADGCIDADGDGWGVGTACLGPDCNDLTDWAHTDEECAAWCASDATAAGCPCHDVDPLPCYTGDPETLARGECAAGSSECRAGAWGPCEGEVTPLVETCNEKDDDCDGAVDELPPAAWSFDDVGPGTVGPHSLAVDASGAVHLCYIEGAAPWLLRYGTDASGDWRVETIDTGVVDYDCSIALDSSGAPSVAYERWGDAERVGMNFGISFARRGAGGWEVEPITTGPEIFFPSLAIDAGGVAHVCGTRWDATVDHLDLRYATNASGGWVLETLDGENDTGGCAIQVAPDGAVHVAYAMRPVDEMAVFLAHATNASGDWTT